jgi:hypothetical protein
MDTRERTNPSIWFLFYFLVIFCLFIMSIITSWKSGIGFVLADFFTLVWYLFMVTE